jgi:hypothetical protein
MSTKAEGDADDGMVEMALWVTLPDAMLPLFVATTMSLLTAIASVTAAGLERRSIARQFLGRTSFCCIVRR